MVTIPPDVLSMVLEYSIVSLVTCRTNKAISDSPGRLAVLLISGNLILIDPLFAPTELVLSDEQPASVKTIKNNVVNSLILIQLPPCWYLTSVVVCHIKTMQFRLLFLSIIKP